MSLFSLVLGLYGPYGTAVVKVEGPACNFDYIYPLNLPVSNKIYKALWEKSALWALLSLRLVAEEKSDNMLGI